MTYDEAIDCTVTAHEAQREIMRHGARWSDFIADCGKASVYAGAVVLAWLGY